MKIAMIFLCYSFIACLYNIHALIFVMTPNIKVFWLLIFKYFFSPREGGGYI